MTCEPVGAIPADLTSLVGVVHFRPDRAGLEGLLLDSFLRAQNPKSSQERAQLREVRWKDGGAGGGGGGEVVWRACSRGAARRPSSSHWYKRVYTSI